MLWGDYAVSKNTEEEVVATNRRARRDFHIEEVYEAGIKLQGTEVKAARAGNVSLQEAYAVVQAGEVIIFDMHIGPYSQGSIYNHEPKRPRKLLLHRREIDRLFGRTRERGYTLIPLRMYFKRGWAKLELAVAKGRRQYDKREKIKKEEAERKMRRAMRRPW